MSEWKWDKLDPHERQIAELLIRGKSNAAISAEVFLSRARVQQCIRQILVKTGTGSTRGAIALLVEERENMSLLRILDQASDGVLIILNRVIAFANQAVHRALGYDPYELHGIPVIDRLAPRSRDLVTSQYDRRIGGEPFLQSYEIRVLCKDGQEKDVVVSSGGLLRFRGRVSILAIVIEQA